MVNTDIGGTAGYRDFALNGSVAAAQERCQSACCAMASCRGWVVRAMDKGETDHNCSAAAGALCCWLKPQTHGTSSKKGCVSGFIERPPGPAAPALGGYIVRVQHNRLSVLKRHPSTNPRRVGAAPARELAHFDLNSLENGVAVGAWNVLRVLVVGPRLDVWVNPMMPETGYQGTATDAFLAPKPLPTRLSVLDEDPAIRSGGVVMTAGQSAVNVDYISVLPASVV